MDDSTVEAFGCGVLGQTEDLPPVDARQPTGTRDQQGQGYATGYVGKWHLGASEQSWPTRQGFDQYRVGVIETTDGTLYRDGMQRAGMPESAIAASEPGIWEGDSNGELKKVRPYT
jgi:arylsulfatase A-like enzyme